MQYISGISRQQMRISSLKDAISPDNQVRFIDAFVENVDLSKLGFGARTLKTESSFHILSQNFIITL